MGRQPAQVKPAVEPDAIPQMSNKSINFDLAKIDFIDWEMGLLYFIINVIELRFLSV